MKTFPIKNASFLLPKKGIDYLKWAVVACDQHTSNIKYWQDLEKLVADAPSTLRLILPEVYLHNDDEAARIKAIETTMLAYQKADMFDEYTGMVLIERTISNGKVRRGILFSIDLEYYSYAIGSKPLIRASEGTVLERIPPRVKVRERCTLDMTHVKLLYDDIDSKVLNVALKAKADVLYDFDLNQNGGRIKGSLIKDSAEVLATFKELLDNSISNYGESLLFAVGDGNHSLAAAKAVYENAKSKGAGESCRYALVEAVNIYEDALEFEPIHRWVKGKNVADFKAELAQKTTSDPIAQVATVDTLAKKHDLEIDFIHGEKHLKGLVKSSGGLAVMLKPIDKAGFFPYIVKNGVLPKKTFSMGEAEDKRYYLETAIIQA